MDEFLKWLQAGMSIITLLGVVYAIYRTFSDPDIKSKGRLDVLDSNCKLKHERIDEIFGEIRKSIEEINYSFAHFKENEFSHIENNSRDINVSMAKLDGKMDVLINLMKEDKKN